VTVTGKVGTPGTHDAADGRTVGLEDGSGPEPHPQSMSSREVM
jgi:hypothetical protein